jgi:hypothetical protein
MLYILNFFFCFNLLNVRARIELYDISQIYWQIISMSGFRATIWIKKDLGFIQCARMDSF